MNFETMKGEADYERNEERNSKGGTVDSRDNGESGRSRSQIYESNEQNSDRSTKKNDNTRTGKTSIQILQVDIDKTVSDLSAENGDGLLLRYGNDKQGFDLAIWNDEGNGKFAFADAGCQNY